MNAHKKKHLSFICLKKNEIMLNLMNAINLTIKFKDFQLFKHSLNVFFLLYKDSRVKEYKGKDKKPESC